MPHASFPASLVSLPSGVRLGETLDGKYRLERVLGVGGMGVVVGATHLQLDQRIAIKFMSPMLMDDEVGVQRFLQEARTAARIQCEHVVRVFDVTSLDEGTPYIVMEYLEGSDLRGLLEKRGALSLAEAVNYVLQAGEAIAEAHAAGVVHRDLKPGNLFCCRRPDGSPLIKVLDFGVSKLLAGSRRTPNHVATTGPHVIMGSPLYSAPEQLRSPSDVDPRADIWALGAIVYELLTGVSPFAADSFVEICARISRASFAPICDVVPALPHEFGRIVARSLARDPQKRFPTIAEWAEALAPFAPATSLLSVERIGKVIRGGASAEVSCDKTLPSRGEPISSMRPRGSAPSRPSSWRTFRWILAALGAVQFLIIWSALAPGKRPSAQSAGDVAEPPAVAAPRQSVAAASQPAASLAPLTYDAPEEAEPPAVAASTAAPVPRPSPTSGVRGAKPKPPPRRAPDTTGFGGLL